MTGTERLELINDHRIACDREPFAILTEEELTKHEELIDIHAPHGNDPWRTPRPLTPTEMRGQMFDTMAKLLCYWRDLPAHRLLAHQKPGASEIQHRMEGFLFSLLVMFDGRNMGMPAFNIVPCLHEDDEAYCQSQSRNWWVGEVVNDTQLHEVFPWEKCHE